MGVSHHVHLSVIKKYVEHGAQKHLKGLAGSINLDCVGIAAKNDSDKVNIVSETFDQKFSIDLVLGTEIKGNLLHLGIGRVEKVNGNQPAYRAGHLVQKP